MKPAVGTPERAAVPAPAARVAGLLPYRRVPARPWIDLWLDGNEGPPVGAALTGAMQAVRAPEARVYPDAARLEAQIAHAHGLPAEAVLVGAGGDELLDRVCRAYLQPGRRLVAATPVFEMLERFVRLADAQIVRVAWDGGPLPVEALSAAAGPDAPLIVVASPCNPLGCAATSAELVALARAAPSALFLADLAYVEYADEDPTRALLALPNALVLHTFSKAWGAAGLRVGWMAGPPGALAPLRAAGGPYPVAGPSLATAQQLLVGDARERHAAVRRARAERTALTRRLESLGATVPVSQANFVLARHARAGWVTGALASMGIAVRRFPERPDLDDALRIACPGSDAGLARLEHALSSALAPEALVFDLDGVLADISGFYDAAIVATAADLGVQLLPADLFAARAEGCANDDWELTRRLLAERGVDAALDEVVTRFQAHVQRLAHADLALVEPGFLSALGLPVAVVTGRPREEAEGFLERNNLSREVAALVTREDAPLKPDPAPVQLALRRLGAHAAWLLGDTPDDLVAARGAGVLPVGVVAPGEPEAAARKVLIDAGAACVLATARALPGLLRDKEVRT